MGKRERHAEKAASKASAAAAAKAEKATHPVQTRSFKAGWRWGGASLGLVLRHPLYLGAGLLAFLATAGICWASVIAVGNAVFTVVAVTVLFVFLIAGVGNSGNAAREVALAEVEKRSPRWGAWVQGWRGLAAARNSGIQTAASFALLFLVAYLSKLGQVYIAGVDGKMLVSWPQTLLSMGASYFLCVWGFFSAAPMQAGWRKVASETSKFAISPFAIFGVLLFWILWIALANMAASYVFARAISEPGQEVPRQAMMSMTVIVLTLMHAPLLAVSFGLAWVGRISPFAAAVEEHKEAAHSSEQA